MIVYVGSGSGELRDLIIAAGHGQMSSRQDGSFRIPEAGPWALDNGAWIDFMHRTPFDNAQFLERLQALSELPDERLPDFCVCPDIVRNRMSLPYSMRWRQFLAHADRRLRWYLAVQDFMTFEDVETALCLEPFDGLFIGGSDAWRNDTTQQWIRWGHEHGLPVHLARINGPNRLQWAVNVEADSVDGTGWVRAGHRWLPLLSKIPERQQALLDVGPDLPQSWIRFGVYLQSIWGQQDWKRWSKAACPAAAENPKHIAAMKPKAFLSWLERTYLQPSEAVEPWRTQFGQVYVDTARAQMPDFSGKEEQEAWKRWIFWELERIMVPPVPPPPERG
jgi:hypothetical protein